MFGHLKAEDFTNLIEGIAISPRRLIHLERCNRCRKERTAVEDIHRAVAGMSEDPVEPDWFEFRGAVRERMLSRAAKRSAQTGRWSWRLAPAGVSVALALLLGIAVNRAGFFTAPAPAPPTSPSEDLVLDQYSIEDEKAVWSRASAFEDVVALGPEDSERFRQLLELKLTQAESPVDTVETQ